MNTSFFHKSTIQNRQNNWIARLKTSGGKILERQSDIQQELVEFYADLLNENVEERGRDTKEILRNIVKLVTPEYNVMLTRPIEKEEVEEAVFQMEKGKALGPDGFIIDFFQSCWDLAKEEIWVVVEESRRIGRILRAFNSTFLTLIPKD